MKYLGVTAPQWSITERKFPPTDQDHMLKFQKENDVKFQNIQGKGDFKFHNKGGW